MSHAFNKAAGLLDTFSKGGIAPSINDLSKDNIFKVHSRTLNVNTTIQAGENASAVGPLTIAEGKTLTVEDDAELVIL